MVNIHDIYGLVRELYLELRKEKKKQFDRDLPFADYFVDRWEKAKLLGFGEGTSVYDSCLILGDVRVGKKCWIGPYTILDGSGGGLEIGDNCAISAGVHIYTHDTVRKIIDGSEIEKSPVKIGSNVYIGPNAVIARGVNIGDYVIIGANSLVMTDVPSNSKAYGTPARIRGKAKGNDENKI